MSDLRFHVALPAPFSFARTVSAARFYSVLGAARPDGAYRRVLRVGGTLALAEFAPASGGVEVHLLAANGPLDEAQFAARARWMLHPELDLAPFYALGATDPALARLIAPLAGLRAFRLDSAFEALAITLIEQQIALTMAQTAERWLLRAYGESLTFEGEPYYAFPRPGVLASLTPADLAPLKITFIRIGRLIAIAQAVASGALDLESAAADPDTLYGEMLALNGVGHWTAAWALIRASGQFRYFGRADVALRAAANQHFAGLSGRMDGDTLDAHFARFGEQAGLASFYLIIQYAHDKVKL